MNSFSFYKLYQESEAIVIGASVDGAMALQVLECLCRRTSLEMKKVEKP